MGVSLSVSGLVRSFTKGGQTITVLRGADLEVAAGEMIALVGQSGSGKSTFLHLLGALEHPTAGEVRVDGTPLHARPQAALDRYRNRDVGFIFQFHHLLPDHSALDNAALPALIARLTPADARSRARARLEQVGLGHRLTHKPGELSGGEQQRVAIARALLLDPGLVLADEPTGNLDPETAAEVLEVLRDENRRIGSTLVVVTHSLELASRFDRVIRLRDGQFVPA
jgi:lipoprotein-releasing system ATP-binding protein